MINTKLRVGKYKFPVSLDYVDNYIYVTFSFNKGLIAEIKSMDGAHWCGYDDPPRKIWRINNSSHNAFRLKYLQGVDVYGKYDKPIIQHDYVRPLYINQRYAADFMLTYKQVVYAGEMGCVDGAAIVEIFGGNKTNVAKWTLEKFNFLFHQKAHTNRYRIRTFDSQGKRAKADVKDVIFKGFKEVVEITTERGYVLRVTPDHEISFNYDEYKEAKDLVPGDVVRTSMNVYDSSQHTLYYDFVVSVKPVGYSSVYDIVCEEPYHSFLANGIVVHNCGKTLATIEAMERSGNPNWWYAAPRSALRGVSREFKVWDCKINPRLLTYNELVKVSKNHIRDCDIPMGIVFDESSRTKNPTAQRSVAAYELAEIVRNYWGESAFILLLTGSPAPKSPADWFQQCKIACPGFLKEGDYHKFRQRLAIIKKNDSAFGQAYPTIVSWLDDEKKCSICGGYYDDHTDCDHPYTPSENEVYKLHERMKGLVLVQFKKDFIDLPDKIYKIINLPPSQSIIDIANTIIETSHTVVAGLTLLRELSDGFQYVEKEVGTETCPVCNGKGTIKNPMLNANLPEDSRPNETDLQNQLEYVDCDGCGGKGTRKVHERTAQFIETPKEEALCELLDEYMEIGRVVIYGGFTGSVDRIVAICEANGWAWIRVDGRGWHSNIPGDPLSNFQDELEKYPRIAFIGQPGAAGMGITLTASPVIIYYSNDFNGESRIQSEDRIHRIGMDTNRGATIIDLIHLPTDELVLTNLKQKRDLQSLTLGDLKSKLKKE
jgi:hypothetical protein